MDVDVFSFAYRLQFTTPLCWLLQIELRYSLKEKCRETLWESGLC